MCQVEVLQVHDEDQDRVDDRRNIEQGLNQDVTGDLTSLGISEMFDKLLEKSSTKF